MAMIPGQSNDLCPAHVSLGPRGAHTAGAGSSSQIRAYAMLHMAEGSTIMTTSTRATLLCVLAVASVLPAVAHSANRTMVGVKAPAAPVAILTQRSAAASPIIRLEISGEGQDTLATAVLVHREAREQDVVLYLLTSAQVQRRLGSHWPSVRTSGSEGLVTEGVVHSSQTALDIAVLKIVTRQSALVPTPVSLASPHPGDRFVVALNDGEALTSRSLNVRTASTRFVIGDQGLSGLAGCLGAPAFHGDAVFGVVAECLSGRATLIALLGGAESFLRKHVPGLLLGNQTQ